MPASTRRRDRSAHLVASVGSHFRGPIGKLEVARCLVEKDGVSSQRPHVTLDLAMGHQPERLQQMGQLVDHPRTDQGRGPVAGKQSDDPLRGEPGRPGLHTRSLLLPEQQKLLGVLEQEYGLGRLTHVLGNIQKALLEPVRVFGVSTAAELTDTGAGQALR